MAWLRIDDGFADHPKLVELGKPEHRWTWLEVLAYCARQKTQGRIPREIGDVIRRANPAFIRRCVEVGLVDLDEDIHRVHDWDDYNPKDPTKADRQARWRAKRNGAVDTDVDTRVDSSVDDGVDGGDCGENRTDDAHDTHRDTPIGSVQPKPVPVRR